MAYDKKIIFEKVIDVIRNNKLKHFDYIEGFVEPCTKTLYDLFPMESNELHAIKRELDNNKIATKIKLLNNWEDSENATLQIAAFKLIATQEERKNLSQNYTDLTTDGDKIQQQSTIVFKNFDNEIE